MSHGLSSVQRVMALLEDHGIVTWLFGGWAEELRGLTLPRHHRDVDLLYRGDCFAAVDRFMQIAAVNEIVAKRLPHKRAFLFDDVMTEIFLVRPDLTTDFWGRTPYVWPPDTFDHHRDNIRVASPAALSRYRAAHDQLQRLAPGSPPATS